MDDREKLIRLLITANNLSTLDREADFLLAHGVTVREPGCWEAVDSSYWRWYPEGARMVERVSYRCIRCGRGTIIQENFCPECGAPMKGESNA